MSLNIAIAQAIVLTVLGYEPNDESNQANEETAINPHCDDKCLDEFLGSIIRLVGDPTPASRHSIGIWLLALVKNCSKRAPIYQRKDVLQCAFTELLSDDSGKFYTFIKCFKFFFSLLNFSFRICSRCCVPWFGISLRIIR